jgi:hypothetical protein
VCTTNLDVKDPNLTPQKFRKRHKKLFETVVLQNEIVMLQSLAHKTIQDNGINPNPYRKVCTNNLVHPSVPKHVSLSRPT